MSDDELLTRLTRAVRAADKKFETVGGSSRHWVCDCLLPYLEEEGLRIVDTALHTAFHKELSTLRAKHERLLTASRPFTSPWRSVYGEISIREAKELAAAVAEFSGGDSE